MSPDQYLTFLMDFKLFRDKLTLLNPNLYVDLNHQILSLNSRGTSGIYLKGRRYAEKLDDSVLSGEEAKTARRYNEATDIYVGWCTHGYVTEGDEFDENRRLIGVGWRSIIKRLIRDGYTTAEKAKEVFGWTLSDYDRMSLDQKIEFEAKYADSDNRLH